MQSEPTDNAEGPDIANASDTDQGRIIGKRENELEREPNPAKRVFKLLGPGLITGASDDDPTAIAAYAKAGASLGYAMLWTALVTFPMMAVVQFTCAKVGLVTSRGLAGVVRDNYSRKLLYPAVFALLVANTINTGADIGAIAAAVNLLVPVPITVLILPITFIILALLTWGSYRLIANTFKWLALALLAYIGASFLAKPDWGDVLRGTFIPVFSTNSSFLVTLVAILGTNISPYLFFWQASEEVEEQGCLPPGELQQCGRGASSTELKYVGWDTTIGMFFSNAVIYFVELATAATLFKAGKTNIESAVDAAAALAPLAGDAATSLFAIGLMASGFLAVPVLAGSSAYVVSEVLGRSEGLSRKPREARLFYGVIVVSMLTGMLINFTGINPIDALFWSAVVNGMLAPPLLVLIMLVANNKKVMGDRVNGWFTNTVGWIATAAMFAAAIGLLVSWGQS